MLSRRVNASRNFRGHANSMCHAFKLHAPYMYRFLTEDLRITFVRGFRACFRINLFTIHHTMCAAHDILNSSFESTLNIQKPFNMHTFAGFS